VCPYSKSVEVFEASFTSGDTGFGSTMAGMGEIELNIYHAIPVGHSRLEDFKSSQLQPSMMWIKLV
jgi:hypothetical protein